MERQIKFRGISLNTTNFIYGSLIMFNSVPEISDCTIGENDYEYKSEEINKKTIGQFTGLKDKHGIDIYEGDIIEGKSGRFVIEFENTAFIRKAIFIYYDEDKKITNPLNPKHTLYESKGIETTTIIGNIHENPELLIKPS